MSTTKRMVAIPHIFYMNGATSTSFQEIVVFYIVKLHPLYLNTKHLKWYADRLHFLWRARELGEP